MIDRLKIVVSLSRPPVLILLGLFAMVGLAQGGAANHAVLLGRALVIVEGFLLFSVVVNDIADEAIDRVNLPGDRARPLVTGAGSRSELPLIAATAAVTALLGAAAISGAALAIVAGGILLSGAYSLPPTRLSARGALASLLLPAGYVTVPFLVGRLSTPRPLDRTDAILLAGLYVGFIGRILLKDFRDVVGDAQFGKRTFLVRYGRRATCTTSAVFWVLGSVCLLGVRDATPGLVVTQAAFLGAAVVLLRALAHDRGARRDEWIISGIAILGRGMVTVVIAHLGMTTAGGAFTNLVVNALTMAVGAVFVGQAVTMVRSGPSRRSTVPAAWVAVQVAEKVATPT